MAETIRNLYLDGVPYLKSQEEAKKEDNEMPTDKDTGNINMDIAKPIEGIEQLTLGANIRVWLPKGDKEAAKKAIQLIKLYSGIEAE